MVDFGLEIPSLTDKHSKILKILKNRINCVINMYKYRMLH